MDLAAALADRLTADSRAWLAAARERVTREGGRAVAVALPALPRRVGRDLVGGGRSRLGDATVDLDAWRLCDLAALDLLQAAAADEALLHDLFAHGDMEEKVMVLRAVAALPATAATTAFLGEAQRTNTMPHFEALVCETDLLARACGKAPGFAIDELNRVVLKAAFLDVRLARMLGVERHANAELSRMLQDLATEREAATRAVWVDTTRLMARAPVPGTIGRILGDLEHGDDGRRLAAAEAFALLGRGELRGYVEERLPRERHPAVQAALERALAG